MTTAHSINVSEVLKDDRQLRSLIGLGRDEFEKLSSCKFSCDSILDYTNRLNPFSRLGEF